MAVVHIESSFESSYRSGWRSAGVDWERGTSSSSVSSSFLEDSVRSPDQERNSPNDTGKRIMNEIPIHLLKRGIPIDGSPFEPDGDGSIITEYDWAPHDASLFASTYATSEALTRKINQMYIVQDVEDSRLIWAGVSLRNERVFYGKRSSPDDFFYMYTNVFDQLCVRVPFTEFQRVVLREANVSPTQLHPNSWAAIQAFLAMCLAVGVTPTIPVFFHYFEVRPLPRGGWVSLTSVRDRTFFRPYSNSYKNFKNQYFKIIIDEAGRHDFHDTTGSPLFPFYWTRNPRKVKLYPVGMMNLVDLEVVRTINALPCRLSARHLVECLRHEDCERKAFVTPAGSHTNPATKAAEGTAVIRSKAAPQDLPAITVDPSSDATTTSAPPLVRKRKDQAEGEKYALNKGDVKPCGITSLVFKRICRPPRGQHCPGRLLAEKKVSKDLRAAMEQMLIAQDDSDKRSDELQAELDKAKEDRAETSDRLRIARADFDRIVEESGQLKVVISHQKKTEAELVQKNQALTDDLLKSQERISELDAGIVFEHEEGFNKALRQASVLAGIQEPYGMEEPSSVGIGNPRVEVVDDEAVDDTKAADDTKAGGDAE
ncbi:hypothetical protein LR48_Vigan06g071300 [Vigna angularis]|uniref:Transposase (putative) gypsy type domain-containing protein n=1 Tax=Phaseolus angularis TaxID=3914 RepID=A0A0L9US41_PHAAN|nr:hypothetical protein LR48_Vigan06g071300 [Vigna angularis]